MNPALKNRPGIWFSLLCQALARHDFGEAEVCYRELRRLGVLVRFSKIPPAINSADASRGELKEDAHA